MKQNKTEIVIIMDRSGSMMMIRNDMEGGLKSFLEDQKKLDGECKITFARFDDKYELVFEDRDINEVGELQLEPRGLTALYDAIGKTVNSVGARLAATPESERPSTVLVQIITDGLENASREFTADAIKTMITRQQSVYNWQFVYLGANQDAFDVAHHIGIDRNHTLNYMATAEGTRKMSSSLSAYAVSVRTDGNASFCDADQQV